MTPSPPGLGSSPGTAPGTTPTQRLYWEDPHRKTALAAISGRYAGGFLLDKTVFHAADPSYHHDQPCDRGHVLAEGHKLKVDKVAVRSGRLVHVTSGPIPASGAKAQLHLDADRRELQARAHAAMHLLVAAAGRERAEWIEPPRVVGGGEVRLTTRFREDPRAAIAKVVAFAQKLVDAREDVTALWAPRDEAAKLVTHHVVALDAVAPGEPTLRLVRCGHASTLPCDAPLVAHTWQVGTLRVTPLLQPREGGMRWGVKVG